MVAYVKSDNRKITFRDFDIPALHDGDYMLSIEQHVDIKTNKEDVSETYLRSQAFSVNGRQFSLLAGTVEGVFPPDKSKSDYTNVLPHLILDSSSLPWEREPQENGDSNFPWLALLLFDEQEQPAVTNVSVNDLTRRSDESPFWPGCTLSSAQNMEDKVQVVDVSKSVLASILPSYNDLKYLAHVRLERDEQGVPLSSPTSIVVCNRLPQNQKLTTMYLVSLENRFNNGAFDFQSAQSNDLVRLVSLYSWQFYCFSPQSDNSSEQQMLLELFENLDIGSLRLSPSTNEDAEKYLQSGSTLLPHYTRTGDRLYSWYRGPLTTGVIENASYFPVRCSDQLLSFNTNLAMFDVSYAAAWELGRLLALKDKNFSIAFYQWKRNHVYILHQIQQQAIYGHLPFAQVQQEIGEMPQAVANFFQDLRYLKGVPFNYIISDEQLLPTESIRFFAVDSTWTDYLINGAFSIGRITYSDTERDNQLARDTVETQETPLTGFLLRSQIVSGWPDLEVHGFDEENQELTMVNNKKISNNIWLVIFEGTIKSIAIQQTPQTIHFGFSVPDNTHTEFYKKLRQSDGTYYTDPQYSIPIIWKQQEQRVVDITLFAEQMAYLLSETPLSTSSFAMQMVEGVPQVIFLVQ